MNGFKLRISDVGSNCSTNCATITYYYYVRIIIRKTFVGFKIVLLTDFIFKLHCLYITYWQHILKQFQLNINQTAVVWRSRSN